MVTTIGLVYYLAILYIILLVYRYNDNMMPDSLMSFFDSVLWAVVVLAFISIPFIAYILALQAYNAFF